MHRLEDGKRMAETFMRHTIFIIYDTLVGLYAIVGFVTISNQLNVRSWIT
jgi:hypothetical protein